MCMSDTPRYPDPVRPQEAKMPDAVSAVSEARRKAVQNGAATRGTLLTGPSGIETSALSLQRTSLLGS